MDIVNRFWPRETGSSDLDLSLSERLKQISGGLQPVQPENGDGKPGQKVETARPAAEAQNTPVTAAANADSPAPAASAGTPAPLDHPESPAEEAIAAHSTDSAAREALQPESGSEIPAAEEPVLVAAGQPPAVATAAEHKSTAQEIVVSAPAAPPDAADAPAPWDMGRGVFRAPKWDSKPAAQAGDRLSEIREIKPSSSSILQERSFFKPAPQEPGQQFLERFQAAVERAETTGENTLASVQQALSELQSAKQDFEVELRERLDGALAEYEKRISSQDLLGDVAGQLEERTRQAADNIFREVQGQAWVMLNAVAGELRSFRDQFGKEIQERVGMLDKATQQALQLKEELAGALPQAEDILRSLTVAGQEASTQVHAASAAVAEQIRRSREALAQEMEAQRESLKALVQECRQDEINLKEAIEKFRGEAGAASDILNRMADQSIERLNAGTEEATAHARAGIENLAAEMEQRILSGGLVEKATAQIESATREVVDPAIERIRNASAEADSVSNSLVQTGQQVVGRLGVARQEIETRLDTLLNEQQSLLEASMGGFQRKATEELGNLVERVVAQSSQQLNDRLQGLCQDLLVTTSKQINGAARATLSTLHHGLKDVFEPEAAEAAANSGGPSGGE
jgi:hypothetical protein